MLEVFIPIFSLAFIFSIISLFKIEEDLQDESVRPFFTLGITIAAWFFSILAFYAPSTISNTTGSYAYTIANVPACTSTTCNSITETIAMPSVNQTTSYVVPSFAFSLYTFFASAMILIFLALLFVFIIKRAEHYAKQATGG